MDKDRIDEIKDSIRSVDSDIRRLETKKARFCDEIERIRRGRLEKVFGMCFRLNNGDVFRIMGFDEETVTMTGRSWNPYQLQAVRVRINGPEFPDRFIPVAEEQIYTTASDCEDPVAEIRSEYNEISPEEFEKIFNEALGSFSGKVLGNV